ncbi:hypothetical protein CMI37_38350 [Candidatus Pacearchaeota archaeon]|nr:hypothetical protein [Candidatus Pacearchaeota archaeon]
MTGLAMEYAAFSLRAIRLASKMLEYVEKREVTLRADASLDLYDEIAAINPNYNHKDVTQATASLLESVARLAEIRS